MRAVLGREYLFEIGRRDRKDARPGHRIARDAAPEALEVACDRVFDALAQEIHIGDDEVAVNVDRSEEHTSELQSLMRISYAVFCLKKKNKRLHRTPPLHTTDTKNHTTT